ncbi:uncharacterized protein LOC125664568 isoform X2 [Ostrea edulis]|uniref:uncharacterized protein LOC125664568 isoform X2 n=1 Tax=Ostrea edulis TaxID=37623 RepID=UPI0024AF2D9A|nr:uncharacterized protein LOC125664568 isoform X2 [Ostrea edulis]
MAGLKYTITFITVICWGSVVSINANWRNAMEICVLGHQQPSSEDNATKNGSWVGKVKYSFPWGTGILQIQTVNKNNTCSDCDAQGNQCEFCNNRIQLNGSVAILEVLRNLKSGRHYILAEFGKQSLSGLPPPTQCMVHRGASHTEYFSCNEKYDDGCHESGENSSTYITISFDMHCNGTTQADMDFVKYAPEESTGVENGFHSKLKPVCCKPLPFFCFSEECHLKNEQRPRDPQGVGMKRNRRTTAQLQERSPNHTATSWTDRLAPAEGQPQPPEEILDSQWIIHRITRVKIPVFISPFVFMCIVMVQHIQIWIL